MPQRTEFSQILAADVGPALAGGGYLPYGRRRPPGTVRLAKHARVPATPGRITTVVLRAVAIMYMTIRDFSSLANSFPISAGACSAGISNTAATARTEHRTGRQETG